MAFTNTKRERIKHYLMEKIFKKDDQYVKKTVETFNVSLNTVYRYLRELANDNKIEKTSNGNYKLKMTRKTFSYDLKEKKLEEDIIYYTDIEFYISSLPYNVRKIWEYSFMEMFNNVIDHSEAKKAFVSISQNCLYTWINLYDDGIGIFNKIATYFNYSSLDDAILSLFKGKLTTDSENHSGEGIFFTSRILDTFAALSSNKIFSHNENRDVLDNIENMKGFNNWKDKKGTHIIMALSNESPKNLKEVFDMFSDIDKGFTTTHIPMKHVCENRFPVSRSQAKRLSFGFDKFKKVILDFSGVDDIGQGFAHELFVVFKRNHPEIEIVYENANDNVVRMIRHVLLS